MQPKTPDCPSFATRDRMAVTFSLEICVVATKEYGKPETADRPIQHVSILRERNEVNGGLCSSSSVYVMYASILPLGPRFYVNTWTNSTQK